MLYILYINIYIYIETNIYDARSWIIQRLRTFKGRRIILCPRGRIHINVMAEI